MTTLQIISAAVDAEFAAQLISAQHKDSAPISGVANATLRADTYNSPNGTGFAVVATIPAGSTSVSIVKQHGPETFRERPAITQDAYENIRLSHIPACSPRQIRLWLLSIGVTEDAIKGQINAIPDATAKAQALIELEFATSWKRTHPMVDGIGSALGLSALQIDQGFIAASKL